ncbi:hypothetical protein HHUSO_G18244 [Huso huso]|uniref:Ig-like domain-containing protein n=1 Tax=Huso huso TaxID=61971 RepID=A0ABR0Z754_HUSHU
MEFRRRQCCFVTGEVARVTRVLLLAVLVLGCFCSVSASEFVTVPRSVNCSVGRDCILNCSFDYRAGGGWDDRSEVNWRKKKQTILFTVTMATATGFPTSILGMWAGPPLFDSVLEPRWDASLLLRNVTEEDAGYYDCEVRVSQQWGTGRTELVLVAAEPTEAAPVPAGPTEAAELSLQSVTILYVALAGLVALVALVVVVALVVCVVTLGQNLYRHLGFIYIKAKDAAQSARYSAAQKDRSGQSSAGRDSAT